MKTRIVNLTVMFAVMTLLLPFVLATVIVSPVNAATTWYVATTGDDTTGDGSSGNPYKTIRKAITSSASGDTINVAAGTYNLESSIKVDKSVSIIGDTANPEHVVINAGTIPINSGPNPPDRDKDAFQIGANNVVIRGFKILNALNVPSGAGDGWQNAGITVGGDITLLDWIVPWNVPLLIDGGTFSDNIIEDCTYGIYLAMSRNVTVSNNEIRDCRAGIVNWNTKYWGVYQDPTGNVIEGNIIENCTVEGIVVGAWEERFSVSGTVIRNNTIINTQEFAGIKTSYIDGPLTITGNDIQHNPDGINILNSTNILVNFNNIVCNTGYGIRNVSDTGPGVIVDAVNNWWGCNDGPRPSGSGDVVSDNVNFNPWLVMKISADPTSIPADGMSTSIITADMTGDSNGNPSGGSVPDGTPVSFSTDIGSISPATALTINGIATATLRSNTTCGTGTISVTPKPPACYRCGTATVTIKIYCIPSTKPNDFFRKLIEGDDRPWPTEPDWSKPRHLVTSIYVQPQTAQAGDPVIVYANIANRSDVAGSYTATLTIDGVQEDAATGSLAPNSATPVQFTVYRDKPGNYEVDINGQKTFFTIIGEDTSVGRDSNGNRTVAVWTIVVVALLALLGILVVYWRRQRRIPV